MAKPSDWRAAAFLLERRWPNEFGRVDARPQPEAEGKRINVAFILPDLKGKSLAEIANSFPVSTAMAEPKPEQESKPTAGELFDGNISKLGRFVGHVPLSDA
jgi:hypothetical protein